MKSKILNLLLILTSLLGFLEWGKTNHLFLFQAEAEIILKMFTNPSSVMHPFVLLPLFGQLLLLGTLFQQRPNRMLTFIGIASLALLLVFMFVIGALSLNLKIIGPTIPFLVTAVLTVRHYKYNSKKTLDSADL
ncbi:hypothetical protein L1S35_12190 [Flavobacterium sp. AS60]|uniref:hypothetical protein n=1 Tax=Flavobacterium anseongense TaxID=2910677 RepID=UPI001F170941|nr:hypothetical protein [Flavobacterium sp. AS60]MCF6130436.1 hypothetical protein [Flavobacterium sp. AS60]